MEVEKAHMPLWCFLNGHDWQPWQRVNLCEQVRECKRCSQSETLSEHQFREPQNSRFGFSNVGNCKCSRCGEIVHAWTSVNYIGGTQNIHVWGRRCTRCDEKETESEELG
jgi:hypothetical protein